MQIKQPEFNPSHLRRIFKAELAEHPKARYADLYKLLHQAFYGPTHIAPVPVAIESDIKEELSSIMTQSCAPFQDIGCGKAFIRFNLIALTGMASFSKSKKNLLRDQLLHDAFLKIKPEWIRLLTESVLASRLEAPITQQDWLATWNKALPLVNEFLFPTFAERSLIDECLNTGKMPSHSNDYRYLYNPHYRVIHHSQYDKFKALTKEKP